MIVPFCAYRLFWLHVFSLNTNHDETKTLCHIRPIDHNTAATAISGTLRDILTVDRSSDWLQNLHTADVKDLVFDDLPAFAISL